MEQKSRQRAHLERILLVCGQPNAGKSRLIRQMFSDPRLAGVAPGNGPLGRYSLSRERCLAGRITSPHEMEETPVVFHEKIDEACKHAWNQFWRINYVSAVQPGRRGAMPAIVDLCTGLVDAFMPERIRVVQLVPDQKGDEDSCLSLADIDGLRAIDVEVLTIDARRRANHDAEPGNVRILADFFDFS